MHPMVANENFFEVKVFIDLLLVMCMLYLVTVVYNIRTFHMWVFTHIRAMESQQYLEALHSKASIMYKIKDDSQTSFHFIQAGIRPQNEQFLPYFTLCSELWSAWTHWCYNCCHDENKNFKYSMHSISLKHWIGRGWVLHENNLNY